MQQASCKFQNSRSPPVFTMIRDLTADISNRRQHLRRTRCSPRLEESLWELIPESMNLPGVSVYPRPSIIVEVVVVKQESKRPLTDHLPSVAFNTISLRLDWTVKAEHNQLNHCALLINSLDDVPSDHFIMSITVSSGFMSGHAETNFLACSTSLASTAPGPSADDTKVLGLKPCMHAPGDEMDDTEASSQCQELDTISSVNGTKTELITQRNEVAHHQYHSRFGNYSQDPALADPLRRIQPRASSTRISPKPSLGAYSYGNHFEFTIIVDSGQSSTHSFTVPDRAPKLDFDLILDPSMNEKSVYDGIPECVKPFLIRGGCRINSVPLCLKLQNNSNVRLDSLLLPFYLPALSPR